MDFSSACKQERKGALVVRKVDAAMRITFGGWYWSVLDLPCVHVGDLVHCQPALKAGVLRVQVESGSLSNIWASPLERVHSCLRTCPQSGTEASSGNGTTSSGPARECSCPAVLAQHTPQTPPSTTGADSTHIRIAGKEGAVPVADPTPTGVGAGRGQSWLPEHHIPGIDRSQDSSHFSLGGKS